MTRWQRRVLLAGLAGLLVLLGGCEKEEAPTEDSSAVEAAGVARLCAMAFPPPAGSEVERFNSLRGITKSADLVVVATFGGISTAPDAGPTKDPFPQGDVELDVDEILAGGVPGGAAPTIRFGGTPDDLADLAAVDSPVILFLRNTRAENILAGTEPGPLLYRPTSHQGVVIPVGLRQGSDAKACERRPSGAFARQLARMSLADDATAIRQVARATDHRPIEPDESLEQEAGEPREKPCEALSARLSTAGIDADFPCGVEIRPRPSDLARAIVERGTHTCLQFTLRHQGRGSEVRIYCDKTEPAGIRTG